MKKMNLKKCPICGSGKIKILNDDGYFFVYCTECNFVASPFLEIEFDSNTVETEEYYKYSIIDCLKENYSEKIPYLAFIFKNFITKNNHLKKGKCPFCNSELKIDIRIYVWCEKENGILKNKEELVELNIDCRCGFSYQDDDPGFNYLHKSGITRECFLSKKAILKALEKLFKLSRKTKKQFMDDDSGFYK